jgi:hypothetical protein
VGTKIIPFYHFLPQLTKIDHFVEKCRIYSVVFFGVKGVIKLVKAGFIA